MKPSLESTRTIESKAQREGGTVTGRTDTMRILIAQPRPYDEMETFVRAHVDRLRGDLVLAEGMPCRVHDGMASRLLHGQRGVRGFMQWAGLSPIDRQLECTHNYRRLVRHTRPDVILAEYGYTGALLAPLCQQLKIPLVVHFHGHDASQRSILETWNHRYRQLFQTRASLVAVSRPMESCLVNLGADPDRVTYSPYGVDGEQFAIGNPGESDKLFVAVGRFVEKKAPHLTLLAFSKALAVHPEARLSMIGDGPLLGASQQIARALGIHNSVEFLGNRDHAEVQKNLRRARALLQHSMTASDGDCEGTPLAVLEAGASGLPVVSTVHAGIPEAVIHGETGLLGPEGDIETMTSSIVRLCESPELAAQLGARARRRIVEHYGIDQSIERLQQILYRASI